MDGFFGWVSISDVWLDESEHSNGGLGGLDKDSVVELSKSQQLESLSDFGSQASDTKSFYKPHLKR